jgi:hypothetical protein
VAAVVGVVALLGASVPAATAGAVGRHPKLTMRFVGDFAGASEGARLPVRLLVRNEGDSAATAGFGVDLRSPPGTLAPRHRNCRYDASGAHMRCTFTRVLRPGETVELRPAGITASKKRMFSRIRATVFGLHDSGRSGDDGETAPRRMPGALAGEGAPLVPGDVSGSRGRVGRRGHAQVTLAGHVDLQAQPVTVRGIVGQTVSFNVWIRERGPFGEIGDGGNTFPEYMRFTAPQGTHVVGTPEDGGDVVCLVDDDRRHVRCPGHFARFTLRIDRPIPGAEGRVVAVDEGGDRSPHDLNRANDVAPVHLQVETMWGQLWHNRRSAVIWWVGAAGLLLVLLPPVRWRRRQEGR